VAARLGRLRSVAVLALAAGLAAACLAAAPGAARTYLSAVPARDGILRLSDEGVNDLSSIDPPSPQANDAQSNLVEGLLFGGLVRLDQNLHVRADGAAAWTISNSGKTYTFTLRPGLRFADGTPLTAQDVVWSFNRAFSPAFAAGAAESYLGDIVGGTDVAHKKAKVVRGIKAIGTRTVQITLARPAPFILDQLAYAVGDIVPRRLVEKYGSHWTDHAYGTGPFMVKQWKHGREIDLAPNPYYWRGQPRLSEIIIRFIPNADVAYRLYRSGALDVMGAVHFPSNRLLEAQRLPGFHVAPQLFTEYLTPNQHKAPFNNVLVRRAFSYAIDRGVIARLLSNSVLPARGILPPGMPGYDPTLAGQTFNPTLARHLLARAGYPDGKGLPRITLNVDGGDPQGQMKAVALREFWQQAMHVNVTLNVLEHGAYNDALAARAYQLAFIAWSADYPDPQNFLSLQLQTGTANNNGGYSNPTLDRLTREADALVNDDARRYRLYDEAEKIALRDAAWMVLDWAKAEMLIRPSVHGLVLTGLGLVAPNWADVTIQ
jgi:oligopeptide transport system substrate-binding protein